MSLTERMFRLVVAVVLVAALLPIQAAQAGIIYTWDGDTSLVWNVNTNWDVGGSDPDPANPPGSLLNGSGGTVLDDMVWLKGNTGTNTIVTLSANAGTIDTLYVGGGLNQMTLSLINLASNLTVTNHVYIGGVDDDTVTQRNGYLNVGKNNAANMIINGNIYSGSVGNNRLTANCTGGTLTLQGDIDPGGALLPNNIDLYINRGTFVWNGTVANVDELNIVDIGNSNVTNSWTLGPGQTITTDNRTDVGRNSSGLSQHNKTTNGTWNIYGGTAILTNGEALVLGNVAKDDNTAGKHHTATGLVVVGDPAEPLQVSTLTLNGEMKVAPCQNNTKAGAQYSTGTLTVNNAGSTVLITGGIEMAANGVDNQGTATATLNINNGLVTVYKHIEDAAAAQNQSTINLHGGTLHLATATAITAPNAANAPRAVDTFTMKDGATLQMTLSGQALPLTGNTAIDLDAGLTGGTNAMIDLRVAVDEVADTTSVVEWDGGTNDWDATATYWDPDVLPGQAAAPLVNGTTYVILDGGAVNITNLGNAVLAGPDAANWALDITDPTKLQATRTGATVGTGPGTATLSDAADVVTRTTDLLVGKVVGLGFDAAALEMYDGSLTLDDLADIAEPNLIIEGDTGTTRTDQDVLVAGGALTINGDLDFGSVVGSGGTLRMTGGTVHVLGNVTEAAGASAAQLYVDGGTLTVDGDISAKSFRTGDGAGNTGTYTVPNGQTLTTSGYLQPGRYGDGTMVFENGSTVNVGTGFRIAQYAGSVGTVIMNGGILNVTSGATDVGYDGVGTLEIRAGTATLTGGEVQAGASAGSSGTIKVGEFGGNPTIYSVQTEVPQNGGDVTPSVFEMWSGTWYFESGNFVQGQSDPTGSTVTIHGGTMDLTGSLTTHTGMWNVNKGTHTTDILGGLIKIGGTLQFANSAASVTTFTIGDNLGANPTVLVGINDDAGINYRNNSTDTLNFRSGTLDLTGGRIAATYASGTAAFNWTGGTLKDVSTFDGDLTQGDADSDSLLVIGASPGTMNVTGNYTLSGGDIEMELLVDPNGGGVAGTDWDLLNVTGTAAFNDDGKINLDLGTYTAQLNDTWGIVAATTITSDYASIADLFDTTSADPGAGLSWDFSQFTTDGSVKVVPEPATLVLLGLGAAGSLLLRRRRQA